jgi:hypothetical protein
MGGGSWTSQDWSSYSSSTISGKSTAAIYTSRNIAPEYDPKNVTFRESCDSDDHPNSTPIIIGLDVTGSMSSILQLVAEKLGVLVEEIYKRNPVNDPQIMFNAVGDAICDSAPLQVTQFESDIRIAEQLTKLYFEHGGGGNGFESYPLVWYFAANHTKIDSFDKHNRKGFIFTMGDDCFPAKLTKGEIGRFLGDALEADLDINELLTQVNRKYEVFHLMLMEGGSSYSIAPDKWSSILGERAIKVTDYTKIPEIIVSILEAMSGKDVQEVIDSWDGSTSVVVRDAISGLTSVSKENELVEF